MIGDVVQVWLVDDDLSEDSVDEHLALLDAEEHRRAASFRQARDRRRYIVAHSAARLIVSGCLGAPASELCWERGRHGKPSLVGTWTGVQANLSHSGDMSMVAVSTSRDVGADIQQLSPSLDVAAMAKRYFSEEEVRSVVSGASADDRADVFAHLWVRKEAFVKAGGGRLVRGLGLSVQGQGQGQGEGEGGIVVEFHDSETPGPYRVTDVAAPPGYRAAVALSGSEGYEVVQQRWKWSDAC